MASRWTEHRARRARGDALRSRWGAASLSASSGDEAPPGAVQLRDGAYVLDRANQYITTR